MKFTSKTVSTDVNILATDVYSAIPFKVAGEDVVKAGMPMKLDGTAVADGTGTNGILLHEVNPANNPNGALLVQGVVDWAKCKTNSGATATGAEMKAILPSIEFRENIGIDE